MFWKNLILTMSLLATSIPQAHSLANVYAPIKNPLEKTIIKIRSGEHFFDYRQLYLQQVLNLAMEKTKDEGPYEVIATNDGVGFLSTAKVYDLIEKNKVFTVEAALATQELEAKFVPARVCIKFGSIGSRIFLIQKLKKNGFSGVNSITDLKKHTIGSGTLWADTTIMNHSGLNVVQSPSYSELFKMLVAGRFELFTRAVYEALDEVRTFGEGSIDQEETLLLSYPAADYFFFNKGNEKIASRVERGLTRALQSGELFSLFWQNYKIAFMWAHLQQRKTISIKNPTLPIKIPIGFSNWQEFENQNRKLLNNSIINEQAKIKLSEKNRPSKLSSNNWLKKMNANVIRVRGPENPGDNRLQYFIRLMELVIEETPEMPLAVLERVDFSTKNSLTQKDALELLQQGKEVDVVGTTYTEERAQNLDAVPVPLHLGLLGQRIMVYHSRNSSKIDSIKGFADIKKLRFCVGSDWPEKSILMNNGLNIFEIKNVPDLYNALENGNCDVGTRSAFEAAEEIRRSIGGKFLIEKHWRFSYPLETVFYVKKGNTELLKRIEIGLERLRANGDFLSTFRNFFGESLKLAGILPRKEIALEAPKLPNFLQNLGASTWQFILSNHSY
jgi:ABC-type amino acid transport substrate-binding protein